MHGRVGRCRACTQKVWARVCVCAWLRHLLRTWWHVCWELLSAIVVFWSSYHTPLPVFALFVSASSLTTTKHCCCVCSSRPSTCAGLPARPLQPLLCCKTQLAALAAECCPYRVPQCCTCASGGSSLPPPLVGMKLQACEQVGWAAFWLLAAFRGLQLFTVCIGSSTVQLAVLHVADTITCCMSSY